MSSPKLGQRLSLISKSNIKYEGTLSNIDASQNTLTLANVTLFGTEGRPSEKGFLPKSDSIYEYIVFRGTDIKDLTVYNNNPNAFPADPAIVTAGPSKLPQQANPMYDNQQLFNPPSYNQQHQPHQYSGKGYEKERMRPVDDYGQRNSGYGGGRKYYNNNNNNNYGGKGGYRRGGGGGGGGGGKGRRDYASHTGVEFATAKKADTMEMKEFDFAAMQEQVAKFEKEKSENAALNSEKYKKENGFFDSLTGNSTREASKNQDKDTFGEDGRGGRGHRSGKGGRGGR